MPTEPDGRTYYYGDYRLSSGLKQHYWHEWPCCSGALPRLAFKPIRALDANLA